MTRWQLHVEEWRHCTRCEYHATRFKTVLGKGSIPCDILFIGEGPGECENTSGLPFEGKAGKILDRIVYKVFGPPDGRRYEISFNNLVACIPLVGPHQKEDGGPDATCVEACRPRLEDIIDMSQPRLVVAVGKQSEEWLDQRMKDCIKLPHMTPVVGIQHPASILRLPFAARPLAEHRCVVIIKTAVQEMEEAHAARQRV